MNIELKEFKNGKFQVWRDKKVLSPRDLIWWNDYQASHDFMYFNSFEDADSAAKSIMDKESLVNTTIYEVKNKQKVY